VVTVRQSGNLLWHRSRHSLQAKRCLHMNNSVFRSWSMHIMHCIRCCRLAIWLPVYGCRSSGGVFEKCWRILLNISLVMVRCCKRVRVCSGWTICPNARQGRSLLKHRICSCKNRWYIVHRGDLSVFYCKVMLTEKFSFPICDVWAVWKILCRYFSCIVSKL